MGGLYQNTYTKNVGMAYKNRDNYSIINSWARVLMAS